MSTINVGYIEGPSTASNKIYIKCGSVLDITNSPDGAASIDLAYVAAGKLDGFWEKNLNLWDVSTGVLLIKEAGGKVTEPDGNDWTINSRDILASNLFIHSKLQEKLTLL